MSIDVARPLAGRRLLVVEDDYFIAADLVRTLEQLGVEVVGPAGSVDDALGLVEHQAEPLDAAILDIHLGGERVFPVADALSRRQTPLVFVTGYDAVVIPEQYAEYPSCEKPLDRAQLVRILTKLGLAEPRPQ